MTIDAKTSQFLEEIVNLRKSKGIGRQSLAKISGIKRPIISRVENGIGDTQLSTIMKILKSLGKTLAIKNINIAK